ncbi:MAG: KEOPS complex subunit Pcc1 [Candidatus Bathyarchaeota archaeon]
MEIKFPSKRYAQAIARGVSPDNRETPLDLKVTTKQFGEKVVSTIKCEKSLGTFTATLDDLLTCIQTTEKVLRSV